MTQRRIAAILTILVLVGASTLMAGKGHRTHNILEISQSGDITKTGLSNTGRAEITRDKWGISVRGVASGLTPGNAYSVWWIVFDQIFLDGSGPPLVLNATGGIANADGDMHYGALLPLGDYGANEVNPRRVFFAGSLTLPLGATVWNHILDHGPAQAGGVLRRQLSTVDEACGGECPLAQEVWYEID